MVLFVFLFTVSGILYAQNRNNSVYDVDPWATHVATDSTPPANFPYPTAFNWNYATIGSPQINGGTVGAMYFKNKFYLNRWNNTTLYRYNGGLGGPSTLSDSVTYTGSIRDLTTDGTYLYGGKATAVIYQLDSNGTVVSQITCPTGTAVRTLAYSPDEDVFFTSNFSDDIRVISRTGALVRTLTGTAAIAAKYGMAYSKINGEAALWVWGQGTTANPYNTLTKINPQTGAVLATYLFGPYQVSGTSMVGIAGGAEVCKIGSNFVLLLNHQNYALTGYVIGQDVIPVELSSFTATATGKNVNLSWTTATESNNRGFEVQRRLPGGEFTTIGFVDGKGTTTEKQTYSFSDILDVEGKIAYRLKQVDFDGRSEFSNYIEVEVSPAPETFALDQNYPNPFNPTTTIQFSLSVDSKVQVKLYDMLGVEIMTLVNSTFNAGVHKFNFDASNLNSGVYFYSLEANGVNGEKFSSTRKMILMK